VVSGSPVEPDPVGGARGRRLALVVAVTDYLDTSLRRLRAPAGDAAELRDVLADPDIGAFAVTSVINERAHQMRVAIEDFLADRHSDDLLLVYLSCHGLVDARRRLYFAARDTLKDRLASSGVEAHWLLEQLEDCRARRQVVILDCCFSGAFARGAKGDDDLALGERLVGEGRGRVVLTASRGTEYSFEGEPLDGEDAPRGSVFTSALIEGIRTGRADTDDDGDISVEDAYGYAFEQVRRAGSPQTPQRWLYGAEGSILLAHAPHVLHAPETAPAPVPAPVPDPVPVSASPPASVTPTPADPPRPSVPPQTTSSSETSPADVAEDRPPGPWRSPRRRAVLLAAGPALGALAALVIVLVLLNKHDPGPSGDGAGSTGEDVAGTFTAESPWRLRIRDAISEVTGGDDNGCSVSLTNEETDNVRTWDDFYGTKTYQMRESGTFRYEVSDRGCLLLPQRGDGGLSATPFTWSAEKGDTPVFQSPGAVTVKVTDRHGTPTCELWLMSDVDGRTLNVVDVAEDESTAELESDGPGRVFIAGPSCSIKVSTAH
jgi:hypothetical protein